MNSKISYYNEISLMMYGFGDSHTPNADTVRLVENIVLKQLRAIVREAQKNWDGNVLKGEDLVFLLRHNKYKMQRFVKYMHHKILKNKIQRPNSEVIELDFEKTPKNNLLEFIENIDETGEFTDLSQVDEVKLERQIRADRISQALNEQKYMDFQKARCASFKCVRGSPESLHLWVDPEKSITFNADALDVLAYLAFQTAAEIIDYAILVRSDAKSGSDPLQNISGSYYTAVMFNGNHRFDGPNPDYSRVYANQPPINVGEIKEVMRRIHTPQNHRNLVDEVKLERQIRADRISQALNEQKYMDFQKARCASFKCVRGSPESLHLWVDPEKSITFNADALDVLAYLAFQTAAEIIDYAILVRSDAKSGSDPLQNISGSYYTAVMFNGNHRFDGPNPDYSRVYANQPPINVGEIKEVMRRIHTPQSGKLNFGGEIPESHYLFVL